jgi:histone deacetylase complex regulatory component SIN3
MVIDNNCSAMRWLEGLRAQMAAVSDDAARQRFRLPPTTAGTPGALIDVLHVRAIQRVYGEHAGEMIDLLKINPCVTVRPTLCTQIPCTYCYFGAI